MPPRVSHDHGSWSGLVGDAGYTEISGSGMEEGYVGGEGGEGGEGGRAGSPSGDEERGEENVSDEVSPRRLKDVDVDVDVDGDVYGDVIFTLVRISRSRSAISCAKVVSAATMPLLIAVWTPLMFPTL